MSPDIELNDVPDSASTQTSMHQNHSSPPAVLRDTSRRGSCTNAGPRHGRRHSVVRRPRAARSGGRGAIRAGAEARSRLRWSGAEGPGKGVRGACAAAAAMLASASAAHATWPSRWPRTRGAAGTSEGRCEKAQSDGAARAKPPTAPSRRRTTRSPGGRRRGSKPTRGTRPRRKPRNRLAARGRSRATARAGAPAGEAARVHLRADTSRRRSRPRTTLGRTARIGGTT